MAVTNSSHNVPPYTRAVTVVPSDSTDLDVVTRAIGGHGSGSHHDIVVTLMNDPGGSSVTLTVAKGEIIPVRVKRVWSTGTTATTVLALY